MVNSKAKNSSWKLFSFNIKIDSRKFSGEKKPVCSVKKEDEKFSDFLLFLFHFQAIKF